MSNRRKRRPNQPHKEIAAESHVDSAQISDETSVNAKTADAKTVANNPARPQQHHHRNEPKVVTKSSNGLLLTGFLLVLLALGLIAFLGFSEIQQMKRSQNDQIAAIQTSLGDMKTAQGNPDQIRTVLADAQKRNEETLNQLRTEMRDLNAPLSSQLVAMSTGTESHTSAIQEIQANQLKLAQAIEDLGTQLNRIGQRIDQGEVAITQLHEDVNQARTQFTDLKNFITELSTNNREAANASLGQLQVSINDLTAQMEPRLQSMAEGFNQQISQSQRRTEEALQSIQDGLTQLQRAQQNYEQSLGELSSQLQAGSSAGQIEPGQVQQPAPVGETPDANQEELDSQE